MCLHYNVFGNNASIIPNSKIGFKQWPKDHVAQIDKMAQDMGGFAKPAYEMLEYSNELEPTIKFVFSSFFVVSST